MILRLQATLEIVWAASSEKVTYRKNGVRSKVENGVKISGKDRFSVLVQEGQSVYLQQKKIVGIVPTLQV